MEPDSDSVSETSNSIEDMLAKIPLASDEFTLNHAEDFGFTTTSSTTNDNVDPDSKDEPCTDPSASSIPGPPEQ